MKTTTTYSGAGKVIHASPRPPRALTPSGYLAVCGTRTSVLTSIPWSLSIPGACLSCHAQLHRAETIR